MTQRTRRIDEQLRQEIGEILAREVGDPRIGFATITSVDTTRDLSHAQVWVSVIGQPEERAATLAALGHAMPFVRHLLGERLRLRRIPELHLRSDDTAERGTRILQLIADIEGGRETEAPVSGETLPTPVMRLPHEGDAPMPDLPTLPAIPMPERASGRGRSGAKSARGRRSTPRPRR